MRGPMSHLHAEFAVGALESKQGQRQQARKHLRLGSKHLQLLDSEGKVRQGLPVRLFCRTVGEWLDGCIAEPARKGMLTIEFCIEWESCEEEERDPENISPSIQHTVDPCRALVESNGYKVARLIGQGGFGKIFLCAHCRSFSKELSVCKVQETCAESDFEVTCLEMLSPHPHIVFMRSVFKTEKLTGIVMDYCAKGSLDDRLENERSRMCSYFEQAMKGICFVHSRDIIHVDLKPANLLITDKHEIKVADFGLARHVRPLSYAMDGTVAYMAPEQYEGRGTSWPADIWAMGCVLAELVFQRRIFTKKHASRTIKELWVRRGRLHAGEGRLLQDMLRKAFQDRPSAVEVLKRFALTSHKSPPEKLIKIEL
eukprot:TRINITY_DN67771_c0_g1_i1.p1 TRINITY_DN67771_c0_g1~~TRINITY_DN67771_c0_g1_i1.p1  ORF type:complete len:370 (+),score=51.17 TRINITY_DN67771_c0_g1_i1:29-1138(+)